MVVFWFGALLRLLAVLAGFILPILKRRQRDAESPKADIIDIQQAATAGDEAAVQKAFADWQLDGALRDPLATGMYDDAESTPSGRGRSTGKNAAPQD